MDCAFEEEILDAVAAAGSYLAAQFYEKYYEKNPIFNFEQDRGAGEAFVRSMLDTYPEVRFLDFFRLTKVAFIKLRETLKLEDSRTASASQKLAIFLYICGHNIKQRPAGEMFKQPPMQIGRSESR